MHIFFLIVSLVIMCIGLAGTILPLLPGIILIYAGYIVYGLGTGWEEFGAGTLIFWGVITGFMVTLDYYAGAIGAKKFGASRAGIWGSIIGGIAGLIFLNIIGLILGTFIGAIIGEITTGKSVHDAIRSGWGALVGFVAGMLFKIIVAVIMIGSFLWSVIL